MANPEKHQRSGRPFSRHSAYFCALLAIMAAVILRQIGFRVEEPLSFLCNILRCVLYISLFAAWGISLRWRIIQPQVRRYLTATAALMVLWITVRSIRYMMAQDPWVLRHLWYLYYLPMLFIPLLAVLVALSLGKGDHFRLPQWTTLLYLPTAALLLLVLTNDLHQLVFVFPAHAAVWANDYRYGPGYYGAVGWMMLCALLALATMLRKCRMPHSRNILVLPFVPAMLAIIYGVLYIARVPLLRALAGDVTVVFCLLFAAVLESCIACGLIQSNTGYAELFMASRLGAQITDRQNDACLLSANALTLTAAQRALAQTRPLTLDKNTLVKSRPIRFGHVLWQEDITALSEAIEQIRENCSDLAERNRIRQENLATGKKILALQEKNRATDLLHRETARQIDCMEQLLDQYQEETDDRQRRRLLAGAAVVGAYIKRYGNLLLVSQHTATAPMGDLARCFEDSFANLELLDVKCLCTLPGSVRLATTDLLRVYRTFEMAVEACLYDLQAVWVHARADGDGVRLHLEFVCDTDLAPVAPAADAFTCEDGTSRFTFRLQKGGAPA